LQVTSMEQSLVQQVLEFTSEAQLARTFHGLAWI